jgi:exonuclease III
MSAGWCGPVRNTHRGKTLTGSLFVVLLILFQLSGCFRKKVSVNTGMPITTQLTISSINCNSFNSSIASKANQKLKINGITKLGTDIIFISDLRLSNKNRVSCAEEVKKMFLINKFDSYDLYHNSTQNKRGVGILINKKICHSLQRIILDPEENFLLLCVEISGEQIVLGSVYGPNSTDVAFFEKLKEKSLDINDNNRIPTLLGGDWNCTYSADPVNVNIDVLNMRELPNLQHSQCIADLCHELNISDPYRYLHYNKVEFSYAPRCEALSNKSRIDYFLISNTLLIM